ncbi:MAG: c-type cytochrome, partial [Dokdonella sp.]
MRTSSPLAAVAFALSLAPSAYAAGDAVAGKGVFDAQCMACHTIVAGKNGFGPSLAGVIGRKSGALAGYTYSQAMANAGLTWDAKTIDEFIAASTTKVPGTAMQVSVTDA